MAAIPKTYRAFRRSTPPYPLQLTLSTESLPENLGPHDVLLRIHAVSLNYRDAAMLREGAYPGTVSPGGISASDAAAEVVAVGEQVKKFKVGDHVAPTLNSLDLTGDERVPAAKSLGGDDVGVLREWAVFGEEVLVKLPKNATWEQAATIACAGVTAWTALDGLRNVKPDSVVLIQGTGGVSLFALLISLAAGIKPIITSSSDEKLEKLKKLGDILTINYKTTPDVAAEALRLTDGKGADYIINNIGLSSLSSDLKTLRRGGSIALIGFLGGFEHNLDPNELFTLIFKAAKIQGIFGGSRKDFEDLNRFLEEKNVKLENLVDKVFEFDDAPKAYEYLVSGSHVGKVVIKV